MELIVRVLPTGREPSDLIVDVEPNHTVGDLTQALCRRLDVQTVHAGISVVRTGATLEPASPIGDCNIVSGDELVLGPPAVRPPAVPTPQRAVAADILAGPESGRSLMMFPGRYSIGRSTDADLAIDDPSVSRHHADAVVAEDWGVTVVPVAGTANGVAVNDAPIDQATPVALDDVVGLGGTRIAFRPFERSLDRHVDRLGQIDFHRTPYRPPVVAEREDVTVGPIPERPEPRKLQIFAMLAPLAAGLAMYAFSRQPQFLALTAVSPIVMVASVFEDRRSGRVRFRDQLARFRSQIGEHQRRLDRMRHLERVERLRTAPDLADLSRRAELRTVDLWARGRTSPDFLRLRLGLGAARVGYAIELERGGAADLRTELEAAIAGFEALDNVPITVDLAEDPVLGVHGDRELVDGVVASLVIQAATLHSPEDLTIVGATASDRAFEWLKWLPHVRSVTSPLPGNHVVHTHDDASLVVARLVEVAGFRSSGGRRDRRAAVLATHPAAARRRPRPRRGRGLTAARRRARIRDQRDLAGRLARRCAAPGVADPGRPQG